MTVIRFLTVCPRFRTPSFLSFRRTPLSFSFLCACHIRKITLEIRNLYLCNNAIIASRSPYVNILLQFTRTFLWADFMLAWKSACMNVRSERHFMSKNEHCVLQTHLKQRRALKVRFCEWRGVNSNSQKSQTLWNNFFVPSACFLHFSFSFILF